MAQEVISDFLIKLGFDAKNVETGLKKINKMERKLTREEYIIAHNLKKKLIEKNYDCSEIQNGKHYFEPVLDCSIDSMISFCNKAKKELVGKKNIRFCLDGIDYEDCEVKLVYDDLETDEEFEKRVSREYDNYLDT